MPRSSALSQTEPRFLEMAPQKMAVIRTTGDPNLVGEQVFPALYGALYTLKFALKKQGRELKVEALRARWPNAHLAPKDQWLGIWGIPVPEDTEALHQKVPDVEVKIEVWEYGTVAQILHLGPFTTEGPTVQRLHDFIAANGCEISGLHEEEYLTKMDAKAQKTLIRYPVKAARR